MQWCGYQSPFAPSNFIDNFGRCPGHHDAPTTDNNYHHLNNYNHRSSVGSRCTVHRRRSGSALVATCVPGEDRQSPSGETAVGYQPGRCCFEELVEGNITRFAAIFHSRNVTDIGPVRSARTGDFHLLSNLNTPLFGNSGGNPTVMRLLNDEDMILIGDTNVGRAAYRRSDERSAPRNLLTGTGKFMAADGRGGTPPRMFSYRDDGDPLPPSAQPVGVIEIDYGGYQITYRWDDVFQGWARTQRGTAHVDYDGVQIAPESL